MTSSIRHLKDWWDTMQKNRDYKIIYIYQRGIKGISFV